MKKYKEKLFIGIVFMLLSTQLEAYYCKIIGCSKGNCDSVIDCVMEKQRDTIEARLDDLINTIKANTRQTKHQTKIIGKEVLAYRRLQARIGKESLSLKEATYLSKKIKKSESLGNVIDITTKGQ